MCHNVLKYFTVHLALRTLWIGVPCFIIIIERRGAEGTGNVWIRHTRRHQHSSVEFDWFLWSGFHQFHLLNTVAYRGPWFFIIIRNTIAKMGCDSSSSSFEYGCLWRAVILHHHQEYNCQDGLWFLISIFWIRLPMEGRDSSSSFGVQLPRWVVIPHHHNYSRPTWMYLCDLSSSSSLRLIVWTSDYPATVGHVLTSPNHPEGPYDT